MDGHSDGVKSAPAAWSWLVGAEGQPIGMAHAIGSE